MPQDFFIPKLSGKSSQGIVQDQAVTYNESGKTYNEAGITYGGVYGFTNLIPLISQALSSQANLFPSTITYNEALIHYNEPLYAYGGLYGYSDAPTLSSKISLLKPILNVLDSQANLYSQGLTYNEAVVSYNSTYAYGGIYGYTDVQPLFSQAKLKQASINGFFDKYEAGGGFHRLLIEDGEFIQTEDNYYVIMEG